MDCRVMLVWELRGGFYFEISLLVFFGPLFVPCIEDWKLIHSPLYASLNPWLRETHSLCDCSRKKTIIKSKKNRGARLHNKTKLNTDFLWQLNSVDSIYQQLNNKTSINKLRLKIALKREKPLQHQNRTTCFSIKTPAVSNYRLQYIYIYIFLSSCNYEQKNKENKEVTK